VDSGPIYLQGMIKLEWHELVDELKAIQAEVTLDLCRRFMSAYPYFKQQAVSKSGVESYNDQSSPDDSQQEPRKTIAEQFNLLKVVDNERYPAYFDWKGKRSTISIEKQDK
jgi:hypothetical protein